MKWIKKGLIFSNINKVHAQCPVPIVLENCLRIYFSSRKKNQESYIIYIDVDMSDPLNILYCEYNAILDAGKIGTFDENGLVANSIIRKDGELYIYYGGWSKSVIVPYKNATGLAISKDNGITFKRYSNGPILFLNKFDSLSATGPIVYKTDEEYIMFYSTGTGWHEINGHLEHTYLLTYATSANAIDWQPSGKIIIEPKDEFEAICKPTIIKLDNIYHMWFSTRGSHDFRRPGATAYRIGYAYSDDLINWTRDDSKAGIDVSGEGWDSEMICYPYIIEVDGKYLMFYNGNGFGKSGFGYAELEM